MSRDPSPEWVLRLATLVGAHLRGLPAPSIPVDDAFIRFAKTRHGMGPLLLAAGAGNLEPRARTELEDYRRALVRRQAVEALQLERVRARFGAAGISWLILKGAPLARQLYGDASLRPSVDVDILVPPQSMLEAVDFLRDLGWRMAGRGLPRRFVLRLLRDVDFYAPGDVRIHLELHQRPLFGEPFRVTGADLFASAEKSPFPAPVLGPALAYYVFAHGALSGWCRLKWLADFVQVLSKLDDAGLSALLVRVEQRSTSASLAASLLLANDVFGEAVPTPLGGWLDEYRGRPSVQKRRNAYWLMLSSPDRLATPASDRRIALRVQFLFHEAGSSRARLMVSSPLSALVRLASGLGHGAREAGN